MNDADKNAVPASIGVLKMHRTPEPNGLLNVCGRFSSFSMFCQASAFLILFGVITVFGVNDMKRYRLKILTHDYIFGWLCSAGTVFLFFCVTLAPRWIAGVGQFISQIKDSE